MERYSRRKKKKLIYGDNKPINIFNNYTGFSYNHLFNGIIGFLEKKLRRSDMWQREELNKYLSKFDCEICNGNRLKKQALAIKINQKNISEITNLSIENVLDWFIKLEGYLSDHKKRNFSENYQRNNR